SFIFEFRRLEHLAEEEVELGFATLRRPAKIKAQLSEEGDVITEAHSVAVVKLFKVDRPDIIKGDGFQVFRIGDPLSDLEVGQNLLVPGDMPDVVTPEG